MTWFTGFLLFIAFSSVMGEERLSGPEYWNGYYNVHKLCFLEIERVDIRSFIAAKTAKQLETLCTVIPNYIECLDTEMKIKFDRSVEEIAEFLLDRDEDEGRFFKALVNIKSVMKDVCTNGTQLNQDLQADLDCFDSIDEKELVLRCNRKMEDELFHEDGMINDLAETEEDYYDGRSASERNCMTDLFLAACASSRIRKKCGHRAFSTFNTILKRSTVFPNMICPKGNFEEIKTTLIGFLAMEEKKKDVFKLGLDLRK